MNLTPPPGGPAGAFLAAVARRLNDLAQPKQPQPEFSCTTAAMPPAANFPGCRLWNTTLNTLAWSDGTNWRRADTGGTI